MPVTQYILNVTCIWLLSLAAFDLLLRRGTFHGRNRLYLLVTFLGGILLPRTELPVPGSVYTANAAAVRHMLVPARAAAAVNTPAIIAHTAPALRWIELLYIAGAAIAALLLIADIVKLAVHYYKGKRYRQGTWTLIETGKAHAPFSLFNNLFVDSRQQYSSGEWQMLLAHEQRHYTLMHLADLLLMQAVCIVFWFHPLVYVYKRRLLLIHEYQADEVPGCEPQVYGRFLIEQALLQAAPGVAHAFSGAPVKARIRMMTRRPAAISAYRMLIFFPLLAVCMLCFTKTGYSGRPVKEGNVCHYKGNTIEFTPPKQPDSYLHRDEQTGKLSRMPIDWPTPPIKLNGAQIYEHGSKDNIIPSGALSKKDGLLPWLHKAVRSTFEQLEDGNYCILLSAVVIDAKGNIVYFEHNGVIKTDGTSFRYKKETESKINALLDNAPAFEPAKLNGVPVASLTDYPHTMTFGSSNTYDITVHNHKVTWDIADDL